MTTPTDYRAALAEMIRAAEPLLYDDRSVFNDLRKAVTGARTLLAAPEAVGVPAVTLGALLHPAYEPGDGGTDGAQLVGAQWWDPIMGCDSLQIVVDNVRAILSCYGTAHAAPVPVGERLPGVGDCDAEGRCWWWSTDGPSPGWVLCGPEEGWTRWLPHWALPLPGGTP